MNPRTGRTIHLAMMGFWAINVPVALLMPSGFRIPYLIVVSIYANFVGHWSGWSAERPTEIAGEEEVTK